MMWQFTNSPQEFLESVQWEVSEADVPNVETFPDV